MDPTTHNNNDSYNDNSSNTRENKGNGNGNRSLTRKTRKKKYKSHSHPHPHPHPHPSPLTSSSSSSSSSVVYRECLKNHAASIGGQALDGCGEFMASPSSNPSDPSSLTCAACSCHRNFHRRLLLPLRILLPTIFRPQQEFEQVQEVEEEEEEIEEEDEKQFHDNVEDDEGGEGAHSTSPPPQLATHMLLALSTGYPRATATATQKKKKKRRFRSKFSKEQKEKMHELSERLGWRLQRRDDAIVEATCQEIGITRGVFKVWMHNNKHMIFITNNKSISSSSSIPPQPQPQPAAAAAAAAAAANANGHGIQNLGMRFNGSASSS